MLLIGVLASACASSAGPHSHHAAATKQVHVAPVKADGSPAAGFRTGRTSSNATCEPGSEAIGQAYRCFAGNFVYDPCWALKAAVPTVLCLPYPWSRSDVRLIARAPLSAIPNEGAVTEPWGLQLASGQRCVLAQGAHSVFDGKVIDYYCSSGLSLLRGLSRTSQLWQAHSVITKGSKMTAGPTQQITIAWFGRPDKFR